MGDGSSVYKLIFKIKIKKSNGYQNEAIIIKWGPI